MSSIPLSGRLDGQAFYNGKYSIKRKLEKQEGEVEKGIFFIR
jgi:hypothetical protein